MKTEKPGILYVDDEEKSLKYFKRAFEDSFHVFTASSAESGLKILNECPTGIGLVLSDQRMPTVTGVQFLSSVRDRFPEKVRILTTAYSDLQSAIQAVNDGHIYQYVVKPWDFESLNIMLLRASEYYALLQERNALLSQKLSAVQESLVGDRIKYLCHFSTRQQGRLGKGLLCALHLLIHILPTRPSIEPQNSSLSHPAARVERNLGELRKIEELLSSYQSEDFVATSPSFISELLAEPLTPAEGKPMKIRESAIKEGHPRLLSILDGVPNNKELIAFRNVVELLDDEDYPEVNVLGRNGNVVLTINSRMLNTASVLGAFYDAIDQQRFKLYQRLPPSEK